MNGPMENPKAFQCKGCGKIADEVNIGIRPLQKPLRLYCLLCGCEEFEVHTIKEKVENETRTP